MNETNIQTPLETNNETSITKINPIQKQSPQEKAQTRNNKTETTNLSKKTKNNQKQEKGQVVPNLKNDQERSIQ